MSGWLPPGVTDKDIDEAAPGYWDAPKTDEELREHGLAMDEQAIIGAVESMLAAGAKARLIVFLDEVIEEYRLNKFSGRIGYD